VIYGDEFNGQGYLVRWWCAIYLFEFLAIPAQMGLRTIEAEAIVNVDPSAPRKPVTTTLPPAATEAKTAAVEDPLSERGTE
jgi:hypothetical protein